ncbi:MAG: hypothetical protein KJ915_09345 [Candidatus Omnitrophica bacterium]|nr:hypothetical protein [Candidatus Omnitrophota bacterium]
MNKPILITIVLLISATFVFNLQDQPKNQNEMHLKIQKRAAQAVIVIKDSSEFEKI